MSLGFLFPSVLRVFLFFFFTHIVDMTQSCHTTTDSSILDMLDSIIFPQCSSEMKQQLPGQWNRIPFVIKPGRKLDNFFARTAFTFQPNMEVGAFWSRCLTRPKWYLSSANHRKIWQPDIPNRSLRLNRSPCNQGGLRDTHWSIACEY